MITYVGGLNDLGWVVGAYECPVGNQIRAFLWTPEDGYTDLGLPEGATEARPTDVNNHGDPVASVHEELDTTDGESTDEQEMEPREDVRNLGPWISDA